MPITDWPAQERPREKLIQRGAGALSDAELLAIFLRTGVRGKTAVDMARELLTQFGGLRGLLEAKREHFCRVHGLGIAKYVQLKAALEMGRRHLYEHLCRGDALSSPADTRAYLTAQLRAYPHEVFACLFLDNRHRVICFEELFRGTIDGASVHPREIVKRALYHNAAALIFAQKRYYANKCLRVLDVNTGYRAKCPIGCPRQIGAGERLWSGMSLWVTRGVAFMGCPRPWGYSSRSA
jgi:DNA repair protein radc